MAETKRPYQLDTTAETALSALFFVIDSATFAEAEKITVDAFLTNALSPTWERLVWVDPLVGVDSDYHPMAYGNAGGVGVILPISIRETPGGPANYAIQLGGALGDQEVLILPGSGSGQKCAFWGGTPTIRGSTSAHLTPTNLAECIATVSAIAAQLAAMNVIVFDV